MKLKENEFKRKQVDERHLDTYPAPSDNGGTDPLNVMQKSWLFDPCRKF